MLEYLAYPFLGRVQGLKEGQGVLSPGNSVATKCTDKRPNKQQDFKRIIDSLLTNKSVFEIIVFQPFQDSQVGIWANDDKNYAASVWCMQGYGVIFKEIME